MKKPLITVHAWTDRFLGSEQKAQTFLSMIKTVDGGRWLPDKWSQFEPVKNVFAADIEERLRRDWTEERHGRVSNAMFFTKRKPALFLDIRSWRGRVPDLNSFWFDVEAAEFSSAEGIVRLKGIIAQFLSWSGAVYATAHHSSQCHYRSAPGNPMKRLDQLNWLTFFGTPYLELLGEKHIKGCRFFSCESVSSGLLLTAAERPDDPSISESDILLLQLEGCLGSDVFATEGYPEVPCRVPNFDLSETVNPTISV